MYRPGMHKGVWHNNSVKVKRWGNHMNINNVAKNIIIMQTHNNVYTHTKVYNNLYYYTTACNTWLYGHI
jgi:ABC-type multidrug transport system ATPase subunit